jgi:ankyrin repeat protein
MSTIAEVHSTPDAFLAEPDDIARASSSHAREQTHSRPCNIWSAGSFSATWQNPAEAQAGSHDQTRQATQWMRLIHRGNWDTIKKLCQADNITQVINTADAEGRTALMIAVCAQRLDVIQALRANPALRVNDADINGSTALILAAYIGNADMVAALQDVDVNGTDHDGDTALIVAATSDRVEAVASLLKAPGINPNVVNKLGLGALHCAALNNQHQIINMLLKMDEIDLNRADDEGHTALMLAVGSNNLEAVELLLADPRLDISGKDHINRTTLDLARERGNIEVIEQLQQAAASHTGIQTDRAERSLLQPNNSRWQRTSQMLLNCCLRPPETRPTEDIPLMNLPSSSRT